MSRILVLAAALTLLCLSACGGSSEQASAPPPVAQTAPAPAPETTMAMASGDAMQKMEAPADAMQKPAEPEPATKLAATMEAAAPAMKLADTAASAQDEALAIAKRGNCLSCHKIDSKLVGPAWKDVGAKYKGDANAVATIASHIKSGGKFGWNFGLMPPRGGSRISDAEVETLAHFIATLK